VEEVMKVLGDKVRFWITLNEPEIYATQSYLTGVWPPQQKNPINYFRVIRHLIRAHRRVYPVIKQYNSTAQIGVAKNNIYFEPHTKHVVNRFIKHMSDWWWNEYFLNQIDAWQDFVGLNYYFHNRTNFFMTRNENKVVSDLGWELHPEGIFHVLSDLKKYNKPVYITENGLADATDKDRSWYIREVLKNVHKAIEAGVDVRGYLHWSLLDNFEWDKGFAARFGLVEVDYETMERKPRKSALYYKEIALNNLLEEIVEESV
jgi:beta-glucosidase